MGAAMEWRGIPVETTHEPGDFKLGKGPDGRGWMARMKAGRGIIRGLDGEGRREVKTWMGPDGDDSPAFVIEQRHPNGEHDEEKLVLGFSDPVKAVDTIIKHYPKDQHPITSIRQLPSAEDWIAEGEVWAESAHQHHSRVHEHGGLLAFFEGKRIKAEPVAIEKELAKAEGEPKEPQDGERWITVHPNGAGTKGQAVLLRPVQGHEGVYRVAGGAGGKLNFMRIHLTKNPEQYKQESQERAKVKREAEKARLKAMTPEQREEEKAKNAQVKVERKAAEERFIKKVLGDDTQDAETPDLFKEGPGMDPKAQRAYHRERLKQAFAACREATRKLTLDAEARVAAGLGEVGGSATPGLAIDTILETPNQKGPGYARDIASRAAQNGMTAERLVAETAAWKAAQGLTPAGTAPVTEPGSPKNEAGTQAAVNAHLASKELQRARSEAMATAVKAAMEDNTKLGDLLKARQELRQAYEQAVTARTGRVFQPGFLATASEPTDEDRERIVSDLTENILRSHVGQFLDEVERDHPEEDGLRGAWDQKDEEGMAAARGGAAWTALHEAGLAVFGQGLLDRDTVETLGPEASAQVLARAIRHKFAPADQQEILAALEAHHLAEQQTELPQATEEAQALRAEAQAMHDQLLTTPKDFAAAAEMHRNRVEALKQARTTLGAALGRFEARAALIGALQSTPAKNIQVPLGRMDPAKAIQAAAAIGLKPDDYQLDHSGGEALLTIPEAGQDKLVRPVDSAAVAERELALSIKRGEQDTEGYLPAGFADRTPTRFDNPMMEPPIFQRRIELPEGADEEHLEPALRRYIGQRWADGHRATDINADIRGAGIRDNVPQYLHVAMDKLVDKMVPIHELVRGDDGEPVAEMHNGSVVKDSQGNPIYKSRMKDPKQIQADIAALGRQYLDASGDTSTLEGQTIDSDHPDFREALHRALAEDPRLQAAHAGVGELTHVQQGAIRDWFYREHHGKKGAQLADALEKLGPEPDKFDETTGGMSLFEDLGPMENPAWTEWQQKRQALIDQHSPKPGESPWASYIEKMGGLKPATEAIQGEMQDRLADKFHGHYAKLTGRVLQLGTGDIAHYSTHLKATSDPEKAAELEAERRAKQARMQRAGGNRFRSVNVRERMEQGEAAAMLGQGGSLFGSDELADTPSEETPKWEKPETAPGERLRLGGRIEAQIAGAMPEASIPFQGRGYKPVQITENMNMGGRFAPQQRGIKAFTQLKRMGLFYGAGSGKSAVMLGGASEIVHSGQAKKVLMAVPSIVQEQFGGEAARFLDPTSGIGVHANPGESFEDRLQAYRDPGKHAVVVTHQSVRDDSVKLLASHFGKSEDDASKWVMSADPEDLKRNLKEAFAKEGINFDALMVDEGHDALNRKGKPDSLLAKIIDAHGHNASHYIGATGSPVKNDPSEAYDWLHKIDPTKYPASGRDEFLRRYGSDSAVSRRALKAELSRYFFAERVGSGVTAHHHEDTITLTPEQHADVARIERASGKLRLGEDPVRWAKELAPEKFAGVPEEQHQAIAEGIKKAVGTFKEAAMDRAINIGGAKMHAAVQMAKDRVAEGKPVVVFAHRLESVKAIHAAMEAAGLRVASITGGDSSRDKPVKLAAFQGAPGRPPTADVLIASDAAATGANLQRGKVLIHTDQPMTAKTHEQRTARIDRLGQTEDVEVHNLTADHPWDRKARERVKHKAVLADIYQSKEGYLDDSGIAQTLRSLRARAAQTKEEAA